MSQNTENIEAKLCAYIDGELDEVGRAEIEKHLAGNPQHRKLLDELMRTKTLLVELPRAAAPPEILESMQSQLERSVLLSESGADAASAALRASRWPQYTAAAAVVLLAVGLGAVVYFVLPDGSHQAQFSVLEQPPASEPGAALDEGFADELALTPPAPTVAAPGPEAMALARKDGSSSATPPATGLSTEGLSLAQKPSQPESAGVVADADAEKNLQLDPFHEKPEVMSKAIARNAAIPDESDKNTMFMVVSTADASQTNEQVSNFLKFNNIHWESVDEPMPNPMDPASMQRASAARLKQRILEMKMNEAQQQQQAKSESESLAGAPTTAPAGGESSVNGTYKYAAKSAAPAPAAREARGTRAEQLTQRAENLNEPYAPAAAAEAPAPAQAAVEPSRERQRAEVGATAGEMLQSQGDQQPQQQGQPALPPQQALIPSSAAPAAPSQATDEKALAARDNYYIARGVTKRQAAELYQQLNAEAPRRQQAAMVDEQNVAVATIVPQQQQQQQEQPQLNLAGSGEGARLKADAMAKEQQALNDVAAADQADRPADAATTQPAANAVPDGQALRQNDLILISIGEPVGPGIKTIKTQAIAEDGSISLPVIGKVAAAGLTSHELEESLAKAYRGVDTAGELQIAVRKLTAADAPATQPVVGAEATNQPQVAPGWTVYPPATQPATTAPAAQLVEPGQSARAPEEEKLDVVIVVQNRAVESSTDAAATQPTTAPVAE